MPIHPTLVTDQKGYLCECGWRLASRARATQMQVQHREAYLCAWPLKKLYSQSSLNDVQAACCHESLLFLVIVTPHLTFRRCLSLLFCCCDKSENMTKSNLERIYFTFYLTVAVDHEIKLGQKLKAGTWRWELKHWPWCLWLRPLAFLYTLQPSAWLKHYPQWPGPSFTSY